MRFILFGLGLGLAGGLIYLLIQYPMAALFLGAAVMFLVGAVSIGGVILLVNAQWTKAIGRMNGLGPRFYHSTRYPGLPAPIWFGGDGGRDRLPDPWEQVRLIEDQERDAGPVA